MHAPKMEVFALCNYATFSKSGGLSVIDIFDEIYTNSVPTTFSRCAVALVIETGKSKSPLFLNLSIIDPKGTLIITKDIHMVTGNNGKGNFIMDIVGMEVEFLGKYSIVISQNDTVLSETNFSVMTEKKKSTIKPSKRLIN